MGIKITSKNLYIAENATLILPLHKELDGIREDVKTTEKIGTTRRGIGPAYEDKVGRRAIRVMDLANIKKFIEENRCYVVSSQLYKKKFRKK